MSKWRSAVFVAAALAAGCTGEIQDTSGDPATGPGGKSSGSGNTTGNGSGNTTGNGSGSTTGMQPNGSGSSPGQNPGAGGGSSTPGFAGSSSVGGTGAACTPTVKATSQIPRLTNAQYDRTIRDLLGVANLTAANGVVPSTLLATDQDGGMTQLAWANYKDVADKIATQVIADSKLKANFMTCTPKTGDNSCFHQTAIDFGRRAFRRPLTTAEIARFDKVIQAGATITKTGSADEIAQTLLYMFLISPSFLQRAETTETSDGQGHFTLSSTEIAQRLAYMLWGTTPDATLNQAADMDQLKTPAQVTAQAQRMLKDAKARDMVKSFHQYYLLMSSESHWGTANRDTSLFPKFTPAIAGVLSEETLRFFDKIAFTPGATFKDFLTSNVAFVNKDTAPLYGLDASKFGSDLTETTVDAKQRPGFLTRLGFLMNFASYTRTSPIYRGAFISKQLLGIQIPAPPPGAATTPLPSSADLDTNRKQVTAQTSGTDCVGCHSVFINPPGFALEAYDAMGQWRTTESNGKPLDITADVTVVGGQSPVHVTSPAELMAALATSPNAMRQYVNKWVSFAYQRESDAADSCTVDQLAAKMGAGSYGVTDLVADLTQTQSFRVRAVEVSQ